MCKLKHKKRKRRQIILSVLASIVVFSTVYALILPAITFTSGFTVNGSNAQSDYTWSNDAIAMSVTLSGNAKSKGIIQKNTDPVLDVELNGEAYTEWLEKYAESADIQPLLVFKLHLNVGDTELDISGCTAEIDLKVNSSFISAATPMAVSADSTTVEASQPDILAVIDSSLGEVASTELFENDSPVLLFTVNAGEPTALALESNPMFTIQHYLWFAQIVTDLDENSNETKLPFINASYGKPREFPSNHSQPSLYLQNSTVQKTFNVYLTPTANGKVLKTKEVLTRIFNDEVTTYRLNPQISYMDRLFNGSVDYNHNYTLKEVWVYTPGQGSSKTADELTDDDFKKYDVPKDGTRHLPERIRFTNNPANKHINGTGYTEAYPYDYTILIQHGAVVRLVFDATESDNVERDVNFFDYDITDGHIYTGYDSSTGKPTGQTATSNQTNTSIWYAYTDRQGINSDKNYSGSGQKYAFGNANTKTGLQYSRLLINGVNSYFNKYNQNSKDDGGGLICYQGCAFGLVTGINPITEENSLPTPMWHEGIVAPDLFGTSEATGKTAFTNGEYSLGFNRVGGTYTLSYVSANKTNADQTKYSEKVTGDLFKFVNNTQYPYINSNEFWPMDSAPTYGADGHDLKFGDNALKDQRQCVGAVVDGDRVKFFPLADKSADHNAYFGMSFSLNFTVEPGYCAPLAYWFYGDDDMWVFLEKLDADGNSTGDAKLIADIGGVHSSVGEYVNLWDYIEPIPYKDENGNENTASSYRLTVFYTERGASGSCCYMRFVVPLDSNTTPPPERDDELVFEKIVLGEDGDPLPYDENSQEFTFRLTLVTADGVSYEDIYDYAVYRTDVTPNHRAPDAIPVRSGTIGTKIAESGEYEFTLRNGEYIVVTGLPDDTHYTINEAATGNYVTQYQKGNHYHVGDEQVNILDGPIRYNHEVGNPYRINAEDYNLVRFINGLALKTEVDPRDGEGVQIGQNILYDIEWGNDRNTVADVTITDPLDEGVDFVGAAFKDREGNILGEWWYGTGDGYTNDLGSINYDPVTRTVTWTWKHQESEATGVVSLQVRVNEKALAAETQPGKFGTTSPRVENQATIRVGNDHVIKTDIVENPVWMPIKTELTPGQGKAVLPGKEITYTITWRNYLIHSAAVAVRDPLDHRVDYVAGSAKAYYRTEIDGMVIDTEIPNTAINYDSDGHTVYWDLGVQPSDAEGYVIFTVKVKENAAPEDIIWNWGYVQVGNKPEIETNHIDNPIIGYELPQTGGIGSIVFYISGAGIMSVSLIAGYILWRKRRREET